MLRSILFTAPARVCAARLLAKLAPLQWERLSGGTHSCVGISERGRAGTRRQWTLALMLLVPLSSLSIRPASALVLYDNIQPNPLWGESSCWVVGKLDDVTDYHQPAVAFAASADATLESLAVLMQHNGATGGSYFLRLFDDDAGLPGALLEEWTFTFSHLPDSVLEPWPETVVPIAGGPLLFAGETYWLSIATVEPANYHGCWGISTIATAPTAISFESTPTGFFGIGDLSPTTLRVEGTPISGGSTTIHVIQGGVHLGTIEPYTGAFDGATNYAYDPLVNSGFPNDGPTPTAYWGQLFFYEGSDGLSFNVLLNAYTGSPNSHGTADWDISVVGSATDPSVLLADDADTFDLTEPVANQFTGAWAWNSRTDGGVIGELSGDTWVVTIEPQSYGGPEPLISLVASDGSGGWIPLLLATGSAGTIVLTPTWPLPTPVPVLAPTALGVLGAMMALLGVRAMVRRA